MLDFDRGQIKLTSTCKKCFKRLNFPEVLRGKSAPQLKKRLRKQSKTVK